MTQEAETAPEWVTKLVEEVADAYDCASGLGWRWSQEERERTSDLDDMLEVRVYPRPVEVNGRACTPADIAIDVQEILGLFESHHVSMLIGGQDEDDQLAIEGLVDGHNVRLCLLQEPPDDVIPTERVTDGGLFETIPEDERRSLADDADDEGGAEELERVQTAYDLAREIAAAWKAEKQAPRELLDRVEALFES
jgi:hypothetical protein